METEKPEEITKFLKKIKTLQSRGYTLNQIYRRMGIDEATYQSWLSEYGPQKMKLDTVQGTGFGICFVMVFVKYFFVGFDIIATLILIPFFISFVTAFSYFFGDSIYIYNKWNMQFEPYSGSWPRFYAYFFTVASCVFTWMFFKLTKFIQ